MHIPIPEHLEAEVETVLQDALEDPETNLIAYQADLASVEHMDVAMPYWDGDSPPSTVPLSVSLSDRVAKRRVGVVLGGRPAIVAWVDIRHTVEVHDVTGEQRQQISFHFADHDTHYHAIRPIRTELRTTPRGTFLRLHTMVMPCGRGKGSLIEDLMTAITDFFERRRP